MKKWPSPLWETAIGLFFLAGLKDTGGFGVFGIVFGDLDFFGEADLGEEPDSVVVDVELVPLEAVACADRVGVMVVVPAFATGQQSNPPVVAGVVLGLEAPLPPQVGGGVDQPGSVQTDGNAEEGSPENHADGTDDGVACGGESRAEGQLEEAADDQWDPVILAEPDVDTVLG